MAGAVGRVQTCMHGRATKFLLRAGTFISCTMLLLQGHKPCYKADDVRVYDPASCCLVCEGLVDADDTACWVYGTTQVKIAVSTTLTWSCVRPGIVPGVSAGLVGRMASWASCNHQQCA